MKVYIYCVPHNVRRKSLLIIAIIISVCGKLKNNNNLLAKALSIQKQENQLLFSEKIQLTSQLQALKLACNKRDVRITGSVSFNS